MAEKKTVDEPLLLASPEEVLDFAQKNVYSMAVSNCGYPCLILQGDDHLTGDLRPTKMKFPGETLQPRHVDPCCYPFTVVWTGEECQEAE